MKPATDVLNNIGQIGRDLTTPEGRRAAENVRGIVKSAVLTFQRECPDSRELSIALTNLEQAALWAVHAIAIPRQEGLPL